MTSQGLLSEGSPRWSRPSGCIFYSHGDSRGADSYRSAAYQSP